MIQAHTQMETYTGKGMEVSLSLELGLGLGCNTLPTHRYVHLHIHSLTHKVEGFHGGSLTLAWLIINPLYNSFHFPGGYRVELKVPSFSSCFYLAGDQAPLRNPPRVPLLEQKTILSPRKFYGMRILCQELGSRTKY
jgi:hypothetical protein